MRKREIALLFIGGFFLVIVSFIAVKENGFLLLGKKAIHAPFIQTISLQKAYDEGIPVHCVVILLDPKRVGEVMDDVLVDTLYVSGESMRIDGYTEEEGIKKRTYAILKDEKLWSWKEGDVTGLTSPIELDQTKLLVKNYQKQDILQLDCKKDEQYRDRFTIPTTVEFTNWQTDLFQRMKEAEELQ